MLDNEGRFGSVMLHDIRSDLQDITVKNTYVEINKWDVHNSDPAKPTLEQRNVIVEKFIVKGDKWPNEAAEIIEHAGIRKDYQQIKEIGNE